MQREEGTQKRGVEIKPATSRGGQTNKPCCTEPRRNRKSPFYLKRSACRWATLSLRVPCIVLLLDKHIQLFVFLVKEFIQAIEDLGKPSAALKKATFFTQ